MGRQRLAVAALLALGLVVVGCSSGDEEATEPEPVEVEQSTTSTRQVPVATAVCLDFFGPGVVLTERPSGGRCLDPNGEEEIVVLDEFPCGDKTIWASPWAWGYYGEPSVAHTESDKLPPPEVFQNC